MSIEREKSKSSAAAAAPGSCRSNETFPRRRKAILRRSGGIESELTEDDLLEHTQRFNPDWMDMTKTIVFPVIPHPKYEGQSF